MKNINFPALGLAILVIMMFVGVGIAIAYHNYWAIVIFFLLGSGIMGYGIARKRNNNSDS